MPNSWKGKATWPTRTRRNRREDSVPHRENVAPDVYRIWSRVVLPITLAVVSMFALIYTPVTLAAANL